LQIYNKRISPYHYQAKKSGLLQNNKNEHNAQNFRFGVFQNLKLMGMGSPYHFGKIVRLDIIWTHFNLFSVH